MLKPIPNTYSLYDPAYAGEIPAEQYYIIQYGNVPSKCYYPLYYDENIIRHFKSLGFHEASKIVSYNRRYDLSSQIILQMEDKEMLIKIIGSFDKDKIDKVQIEVYYNIKRGEIEDQLQLNELVKFEKTKKKSNINLIKVEHGHLDIEEYDLTIPDIDLELNYGESFLKIHNAIISRLNNNNDKGIVLLHGDPGTGKTTYLKYLTKLIKDKDVLFVPPSMAEALSEPSIIPFLMEHKNSILIIEDAERVISDREINGSPAGVSNILNLTDGILGDCLNIQIIATFNMKREKIDAALLRKGRLIAEHKFEKLSINETNKLLKHLNKEPDSVEELSLADIYNIDNELFKCETKRHKIGF